MSDKEKKSEEQLHYENLISFFKYLISITIVVITLFASVLYFIIGNTLDDVKSNINSSLQPITQNFESTINSIRDNLKDQNELSSKRFEAWSLQSENYVLEETKKRVENAFKDKNIQSLLEETSKNELEPRIQKITTDKVNEITSYYNELTDFLPKAILAVDQIRNGYRTGLDTLIAIINRSSDKDIKLFAIQLYKEKGNDWFNNVHSYSKDLDMKGIIKNNELGIEYSEANKKEIIQKLIEIINHSDDLERISNAFYALSKITNKSIEMFDFITANKIANSNN